MKKLPNINWLQIDFILLFSVLFLVVVGAAIVYSASSFKADNLVRQQLLHRAESAAEAGDAAKAEQLRDSAKTVDGSTYFIRKQAIKILVGVVLMVIVAAVHYEKWLGLSPLFFASTLILLILLFTNLPIVVSRDEAARWLRLGGFTIQPSDFARYALILLLARLLYEFRDHLNNYKVFLSFLSVVLLVVGLVAFEKDLGTAVMITLIAFVMFYLAHVKLGFLFLTGMSFFAGALIYLQFNPYMIRRMIEFIKPLLGVGEPSFQIQQSLISFALGGPFGVGIGNYPVTYPQYALPRWQDPLGHAHNYLINLAAETGLLGLTGYAVFWGAYLVVTLRLLGRTHSLYRGYALAALGLFIHLHVHNLVDNLYVQGMALQVAFALTLLYVAQTASKRETTCASG